MIDDWTNYETWKINQTYFKTDHYLDYIADQIALGTPVDLTDIEYWSQYFKQEVTQTDQAQINPAWLQYVDWYQIADKQIDRFNQRQIDQLGRFWD